MPWRIALAFALAPLLISTVAVVGNTVLANICSPEATTGAGQTFADGNIIMIVHAGGAEIDILRAATIFAYPCALLLGFPALLALRSAGRLWITPMMLTGALIIIFWLLALVGLAVIDDLHFAAISDSGLRPEITLSDLSLMLRVAVAFGVLASVGGGVFWLLVIADWRRHVGIT